MTAVLHCGAMGLSVKQAMYYLTRTGEQKLLEELLFITFWKRHVMEGTLLCHLCLHNRHASIGL